MCFCDPRIPTHQCDKCSVDNRITHYYGNDCQPPHTPAEPSPCCNAETIYDSGGLRSSDYQKICSNCLEIIKPNKKITNCHRCRKEYSIEGVYTCGCDGTLDVWNGTI